MRLRTLLWPLSGIVTLVVGFVVIGDLNGSLVYYLTADEALERRDEFPEQRRFRLAGEVGGDDVRRSERGAMFTVAGENAEVTVVHRGVVPHLFEPGIPVVVEGAWQGESFHSDTMLIMHDEQYYPEDDDHPTTDTDVATDAAMERRSR